ncbi:hypothetical protein AB0G35_01820 [Streptomyces sp. NPDC021749]|uniref:hypothetical protein n=1 Tax=Streptomyces sp. NPDC021749 TaxID=3154905 RepID=UPI00340D6B4E
MHKAVRLLASATVVAVAAGALPIVASAPAQANTRHCTTYLADGYTVGPKARQACSLVGSGNILVRSANLSLCRIILGQIHVKPEHAMKACELGLKD